ncbi:MAG TPA: ABC transporter permease [Rugosimonospora sp.]|nr:ABC transporter permease [Rugosimonospora sp.]
MTILAEPLEQTEPAPPRPARRRPRGRLGDRLLFAYTWLIVVWLMVPIAVMILFGFNDLPPRAKYNQHFQGFTLRWYTKVFDIADLTTALLHSLEIAVCSTIISCVLGTMIGLALGRYRFRGQGVANLVMFATISSPEIIMGASLLTLFITSNTPMGFATVLFAHVMFSLSFVAIVVRSRVLTLDRYIEEAARDLGAGAFTTFRLVTLPMIFPAVLAGALLSFALSVDDFVITSFVRGGSYQTFPVWIWGATKIGIPPEVNVMGTLIFVAGLLLAGINAVVARRRAR